MKRRFRLVMLLTFCLMLLVSGCQYIPQSVTSMFRPQRDEVSVWLQSIAALSPAEQGRRAAAVWQNRNAPAAVRERALSVMASRPGDQANAARKELGQLYARSGMAQRAALERAYWADLEGMDTAAMRAATARISANDEARFPWNLLMLKAARRGLLEDNAGVMSRLSAPTLYADPTLFGLASAQRLDDRTLHVALVLPLSGNGSTLGRQVSNGALAAADRFRNQGAAVDVRIIDSSRSDWTAQVKALPSTFAMVGGPLLPSQTKALRDAAAGRAVFAFTASLPSGVNEGADMWRFFASPQDQVETLLDATRELGIHSVGIFSPEDSYSKRMNSIFQSEAQRRGLQVTYGTYSAKNLSAWPKEASAFLKTRIGSQRGSIPEATAGFEAIFLPDSWKNMDMLISSLHYGGAHNMLMMGTSIWEQSLGENTRSNAATFALTVFPGAWDDHSTASGAVAFRNAMASRGNRVDDWSALGFDFVQTAAAVKLQPGWTPSSLNDRLSSRLRVDWAGAPVTWDSSGKAHRQLFLMRPAAVGCQAVDASALRSRYESGESTAVQPAPAATQSRRFQDLIDSITQN